MLEFRHRFDQFNKVDRFSPECTIYRRKLFNFAEVMTNLDTTYLERCVNTLAEALKFLDKTEKDTIQYKLYRSAAIKEFEIIMELSANLIRKSLKPYFRS